MIINAILSGSITFCALALYLLGVDKDPITLNALVLLLLILLLTNHYFYAKKYSSTNPLLSLDVLFLIGIVSMCFSFSIMMALGVPDINIHMINNVPPHFFYKSLPVSLFASSAFSMGFILSRKEGNRQTYHSSNRLLRRSSSLYFLVPGAVLLMYFYIFAGDFYISGRYSGVTSIGETYTVALFVARILITIGAALIAIKTKHLIQFFSFTNSLLLLPYYFLLFLLIVHGDRGSFILCISPLMYLFISRIPKRYAAITLITSVVFALLIAGILRTARGQNERSATVIYETAGSTSITDGIKESAINIGNSGLLLSVAMNYQEKNGKTMGQFALNSILGVIPYSRRYLKNMGILPQWQHPQSSALLTDYILGPHATSGVGTSTTAEFYLEFGWIGVLVGHFFIGWGAGYIQRHGEREDADPYRKLLYVFCIGVFAIMARYSAISSFVRTIGYAFFAISAVRFLTKRAIRRR